MWKSVPTVILSLQGNRNLWTLQEGLNGLGRNMGKRLIRRIDPTSSIHLFPFKSIPFGLSLGEAPKSLQPFPIVLLAKASIQH
jgi:hypothetical protein